MRDRNGTPRIGVKLRHARQVLGLSLEELGARIGLTEGYLSKIENDRATPSMAALHRLVQALGINMNAMFGTLQHNASEVFVLRQNERPHMETGHRRSGNHVVLEQLVPSGPEYLLQINVHVIEAGGGSLELISHKGQEFGYVLEGSVELLVETNVVALEAGDAFYFNSELGHGYRNIGSTTVRILWVNTPPTF